MGVSLVNSTIVDILLHPCYVKASQVYRKLMDLVLSPSSAGFRRREVEAVRGWCCLSLSLDLHRFLNPPCIWLMSLDHRCPFALS